MSPKAPDKVTAEFNDKRLEELRKARGWTQAYVAEQLGCSDRLIWRWERAKCTPHATLFIGLDRLFGVRFEDWFK